MGLSFVINGLKSLKVVGRKRVQFHLDELVMIQRQPNGAGYFWICRMAEADPHAFRVGVSCAEHGINFGSQRECEEAALEHLCQVHRGVGGAVRDPGHKRSRARREREFERWTNLKGVKNGNG